MFKILVIQTDPSVAAGDAAAPWDEFREQGFVVETTAMAGWEEPEASQTIAACQPDMVVIAAGGDAPSHCQGLCKSWRTAQASQGIPMLFLSTHPDIDPMAACWLEQGAHDFIASTCTAEERRMRLRNAIRLRQETCKTRALSEQLNRMNSELYERNLAVEKELYTTRQLQQSLLPPFIKEAPPPAPSESHTMVSVMEPVETVQFSKCHLKNEHVRITGVYLPSDALGGDIYDVIQFPDGTGGVALADVSGHGVPAAFITAIFKSSFYRTTYNYSEPGDILYHLNNELMDLIKTGHYITSVYTHLSPDAKLMSFSGAGHPYPMYYKEADQTIHRLQENGTPMGWFKDSAYPQGSIALKSGDKVLIFSDGISEMKNAEDQIYGEDNLEALFQDCIHEPDILDAMILKLSDYTQGHPLDDDVSAVLIEKL
ncbi:MAG: SpoIIE family protein phosphatase [Candidatus Melainabacteria bacterium]